MSGLVRGWWLAGAVLLAGCLSIPELRERPPARVATHPGHYLTLATCTAERAAGEGTAQAGAAPGVSYEVHDRGVLRTATVLATTRFPGGLVYTVPTPLAELTFRETDDDTVRVEARRSPLGTAVEGSLWPLVAHCAARGVTR